MADSSVAITAGAGTPIRVLTALGAASADQQVVTLADSAGNLLGTTAGPVPVTGSGTAGTPATGVQTVQGVTGGTALPVSWPTSATPTITSPASITTVAAVVLASNTARKGAAIYNESGAIAYLALGTTATLTAYTTQIPIGGYYEVPFQYTGALWGITVSGTAVLRVTEVT